METIIVIGFVIGVNLLSAWGWHLLERGDKKRRAQLDIKAHDAVDKDVPFPPKAALTYRRDLEKSSFEVTREDVDEHRAESARMDYEAQMERRRECFNPSKDET